MPADRDIDVVEETGAHHEALGRPALFGRAAVIANASRKAGAREIILDRGRGKQRCGAEQVVAAAMPGTAGLDRYLGADAGLLAETGQRVVFAEDRNHGSAIAGFAHHRSWNPGNAPVDAKAFTLEHRRVPHGGAMLLVVELRLRPDPVAQLEKRPALRLHRLPELGIDRCSQRPCFVSAYRGGCAHGSSFQGARAEARRLRMRAQRGLAGVSEKGQNASPDGPELSHVDCDAGNRALVVRSAAEMRVPTTNELRSVAQRRYDQTGCNRDSVTSRRVRACALEAS